MSPTKIAPGRVPITVGRPTRLRSRLVKGKPLQRTRTPSIDECPCTPRRCLRTAASFAWAFARAQASPHACAWNEDDEETIACKAEALPATNRLRCSRARGLRHRDPVSGAPSPAEPLLAESRPARPSCALFRGGQRTRRRSSTSAIQTIREHHLRIDRSPRHRASRARACALCSPHVLSPARTGASTRPQACARNLASSP